MEFAESLRLAVARGDLASIIERAATVHITREMCRTWPAVYEMLRMFSPSTPVYLRQNTFGWDISWCAAKQAALFYEELRTNYVCLDVAPTYLGAMPSDLGALIHKHLVSVKTSGNEHTLQILGVPLVDGDIPCTLIQENSSDKHVLASRKIVCEIDMNTHKVFISHSPGEYETLRYSNFVKLYPDIAKNIETFVRRLESHGTVLSRTITYV